MRTLILLFSLFAVMVNNLGAATFTAASTSLADVTTAYRLCANGDTLQIPAGTSTWTNYLYVQKAINIIGAGVGSTIILDGNRSTSLILRIETGFANLATRLSGIEFGTNGNSSASWPIELYGGQWGGAVYDQRTDTRSIRIDHCQFDRLMGNPSTILVNNAIGVFDHNKMYLSGGIGLYLYNDAWDGSLTYGGASFSDPSGFGTSKFWFMEDNLFVNDTPFGVIDCYKGARWVFRHNTVYKSHLEIHGSEVYPFRGGRAGEVYNNTFVGDTLGEYIINARSGVFICHDNTATNFSMAPKFQLVDYRAMTPTATFPNPGSEMNGASRWDVNDTAKNPYYSGAAVSGTTGGGTYGYPTVTVAGSPWTVNQWAQSAANGGSFQVYKLTTNANNGSLQYAGFILENTANTLTFGCTIHPPAPLFVSGDTFVINKVIHGIDQPGRAGGDLFNLLSKGFFVSSNNQITDPCYEWSNNIAGGATFHFNATPYGGLIRQNEHYFNSTPKPGYTPYTYPHPLTTGVDRPGAPVNLHIVGP